MNIQWKGVMPATVTQFNADLSIDHSLMAEHGKWLTEQGCSAIIVHGSLGEGATLSFAEKVALQKTYVEAVPNTPITSPALLLPPTPNLTRDAPSTSRMPGT